MKTLRELILEKRGLNVQVELNNEKLIAKVKEDLKKLTNLDFELLDEDDYDGQFHKFIATDKEEEEFIYVEYDKESFYFRDLDDQTKESKYYDKIYNYLGHIS